MRRTESIDQTYPLDAVLGLYRSEPDARLKERLFAIMLLYEGKSVAQIATLIKHSPTSIREWRRRWNVQGYKGLQFKLSGGRKSQMSVAQWEELVAHIQDKGMSIEDVRQYIEEHYGIKYGYHMVWRQLREKRGISYSKPFIVNDKMPLDAEDQFKKR